MPQPAALLERLLDAWIGVEDTHAAEQFDGLEEMSGRADRRVDLQTITDAGVEVVRAVSGCRVYGAGAGVEFVVC